MPNESEQKALSQIKDFLQAGHSLDALRQSGWGDWIDHLQAGGYDLRTGQLVIQPPENEPPLAIASPEDEPPAIQSASTGKLDIAQPEEPPLSPPIRPAPPAKRRRPWYRSGAAMAAVIFVGILAVGGVVGNMQLSGSNQTAVRLAVGDCAQFADLAATENSVDCSAAHDVTVTGIFEIEGSEYPGLDTVERMAEERCTAISPASSPIYPTNATWNVQADRQIACLLPVDYDLRIGDCLIYGQRLQRIGCANPHDARVSAVVSMPESVFPGNAAVQTFAEENCPLSAVQYYFPTLETWKLGGREIACVDE